MVRVDVWTIVGGVAAVFAVSWMLGLEVLFLLAIVLVSALALVLGVVLGCLTLAERLSVATVDATTEKPGWREVRASSSRHQIAG
jgi:hypothetical protein